MCRSGKDGKMRRCKRSDAQRLKDNERKRRRYSEKKAGVNNGRSNSRGTSGVSEASGLAGGSYGFAEAGDRVVVDGFGHQDGNRSKSSLVVGGRTVRIIGVHNPPEERARQLRELGKTTPDLYEVHPEDSSAFHDKIMQLQVGNKWHASVYVYPVDDYKDMRVFLASDGESGIAIKDDGDIVSVFSSPIARDRQSANSMIATAVSLGGTKLDCFDTVLPKIYAQEGFVEVDRDSWSDEYKPKGWDYETYKGFNNGRPDVVYMEYAG
jgi:hypothetical protein